MNLKTSVIQVWTPVDVGVQGPYQSFHLRIKHQKKKPPGLNLISHLTTEGVDNPSPKIVNSCSEHPWQIGIISMLISNVRTREDTHLDELGLQAKCPEGQSSTEITPRFHCELQPQLCFTINETSKSTPYTSFHPKATLFQFPIRKKMVYWIVLPVDILKKKLVCIQKFQL